MVNPDYDLIKREDVETILSNLGDSDAILNAIYKVRHLNSIGMSHVATGKVIFAHEGDKITRLHVERSGEAGANPVGKQGHIFIIDAEDK